MAIYLDGIQSHDPSSYHPPGIAGDDWCEAVSDDSLVDLTLFLTTNLLTIGQLPTSIRTPLVGSNCTYVALDPTMRTAAIAAGATATTSGITRSKCFDYPGSGSWEP